MTNREKFKEKIIEVALESGDSFGVVNGIGKIKSCKEMDCSECSFDGFADCGKQRKKWLDKEYKACVNWQDMTIDSPILVKKKRDDEWKKAYCAKYEHGKIYAWDSGATSWSTVNGLAWGYKYAKLIDRAEYINTLPFAIPTHTRTYSYK